MLLGLEIKVFLPPFIEATGWSLNNNGVVTLVANASHVTPHLAWQS